MSTVPRVEFTCLVLILAVKIKDATGMPILCNEREWGGSDTMKHTTLRHNIFGGSLRVF
jgi:hypothetical protein